MNPDQNNLTVPDITPVGLPEGNDNPPQQGKTNSSSAPEPMPDESLETVFPSVGSSKTPSPLLPAFTDRAQSLNMDLDQNSTTVPDTAPVGLHDDTPHQMDTFPENASKSIDRLETPSTVSLPAFCLTQSPSSITRTQTRYNTAWQPKSSSNFKHEELENGEQGIDNAAAACDIPSSIESDALISVELMQASGLSIFGPRSGLPDCPAQLPAPSTNPFTTSEVTKASSSMTTDDEDDDLMEICLDDAPPATREIWKEFKFSNGQEKDVVENFKEEPTNSPLPARALDDRTNEDYIAEMRTILPLPKGNIKSSCRSPSQAARYQDAGASRAFNSKMHTSGQTSVNGEDAWMFDTSPEDDEVVTTLEESRNKLEKKRSKGTITSREVEELFEIQAQIQKHYRKAKIIGILPVNDEEQEALFVQDTNMKESVVVEQHRLQHDGDDHFPRFMEEEWTSENGNIIDQNNLTKRGKPRKSPSKARKSTEPRQRKVHKKRAREIAPKVTKRSAQLKSKEKNKSKKVEAQKAPTVKNHRNNSWGYYDEIGEQILDAMMSNDPISERLCNLALEDDAQPKSDGQLGSDTQFQILYSNILNTDEAQNAPGDKARLQAASRSFGRGVVHPQDGKWHLKGMKSLLYHHQLLGAEWMLKREFSKNAPHGGFVADAMGLGKTVQTLACMVANPPTALDIKSSIRATLIVCPASIGLQWVKQIEIHTERSAISRVILYRSRMGLSKDVIQDMDVIVASYSEVMKQLPFPTQEERQEIKAKGAQGYKDWWESVQDRVGPLHQIRWYRVVLDEAHSIKNNAARTSLACQNLNSVYRWCLSGTPLMNRLEELFPYFRFLKANYCMTQETFNKYFCDPDAPSSYIRIETLFSYAMIRRTIKTSILGRPIITLPAPHPFIRYISFSPAEKIIYRITERVLRTAINTYVAKKLPGRNYGTFMVLLLRLRQCTSHFFLIENTIKETWKREDVQELEHRLRSIESAAVVSPFYQQIGVWVDEAEAARSEGVSREAQPFGRSNYGHNFDIGMALKTRKDAKLRERDVCGICSDVLNEAESTNCGHLFCKDCIRDDMHHQANTSDYATCPTCNNIIENLKRRRDLDYNYDGSTQETEDEANKQQGKYGTTGADMRGYEPLTKDSTWVAMSDSEPGFSLAPSAKTTALKALLLKIFEDAPMDKVVIYVQFRTLARIIGRICQEEGWGFLYFDGCLSRASRDDVVNTFRNNDNAKILISGIKCGGLGLNLECANRCISLDLWWNHAVEQQAFGRVFRLGQQKETHLGRIAIKDSIDMRMLTMQAKKLAICEKAIQDGEMPKKQNLSFRELASLFGFLKVDQDNNILSVEPDYEDLEEWNAGGAGRIDDDEI